MLRSRWTLGLAVSLSATTLGTTAAGQTLVREIAGRGNDFGAALASGDFDGDGVKDLAVGAPGLEAVVYSGATGQDLLRIDRRASRFGISVAFVGDLDGDGGEELIVGDSLDDTAFNNAGRATLYSSKDGSVLYEYFGAADEDRMGQAVAGTGDLDGRGKHDFLIGVEEYRHGPGYVLILAGEDGSLIERLDGAADREGFGLEVRGGELDFDADGTPDFYVGAPYENFQGAGYVFSGADRSILYHLQGTSGQGFFGSAGSLIPDVNGDGHDEALIAGVYDLDPNGVGTGQVLMISGADGSVLDTWYGSAAGDLYGHDLAPIGDVNGDGVQEVAIGARDATHSGGDRAGSFEVRSVDGRILYTGDQEGDKDQLGAGVCGLGDLDGDGLVEFAIGAARRFDSGNNGWVGIYEGSSLVFDLHPDLALEGETVDLTLRGVPQKLYMVFLHAIDGAPFTLKLVRASLDGAGVGQLSGVIPPGAAGVDLTLSAFSIPAGGGVVESNFEILRLR